VTLCGVIGQDKEGEDVLGLLRALKVSPESVFVDPQIPTIVKTRVMAASQHHHSQQLVRIDHEDTKSQTAEVREKLVLKVEKEIAAHDLVIISDYGKGAVSPAVLQALANAREKQLLGLGVRPYVVDPYPSNTEYYRGLTIGTPNRHEAESSAELRIRNIPEAFAAAKLLKERWKAEMMAVTLGEAGLVISGPRETDQVHLETQAKEVYDVSGAGDCVTAVLGLALAGGASPSRAGMLANLAAGIVISEMGTVAIDKGKLIQRVKEVDGLSLHSEDS
jgi:D-beta-D-heptose 7-phosphate kinase/D-beta-D-heptose 1-phosphate adenosyltransferase